MAEANEIRGEMKVAIGDQEFVLVPSFRRVAQVESTLGKSLLEVAHQISSRGITMVEVATIVDLMAQSPHPTREEIGQLIVDRGLISVVPLLGQFLERVLAGPARGNPEPEAR